jgi:hypothetical protein
MTRKVDDVSQRLIRKGALVAETYLLFSGWQVGNTLEANFDRAFNGRFKTVAWENEVRGLRTIEGERIAAVNLGSYFAGGIETEEQLDAALTGIREECARLIGAGKKVFLQ